MCSKLILGKLALATLAALALWSTAASASPVLTFPTGTKMIVNSKISAHNIGVTKFTTPTGTIECSTAEMTGTLVTNLGNDFEVSIESAAYTGTGVKGDCTGTGTIGEVKVTTNPATNGLPWCLWSKEGVQAPDEFSLSGGKCTAAPRATRIVLDYTATKSECTFEKAAQGSGMFKTHPEDAQFTLADVEFTKVAGAFCPANFKLDATLTLEKDEAGTNPIYVF